MTINLKQVIDAVESANEVYTTLYDTQTGKTIYLPDEIITDEWDEDLEALIEDSPAGRFLHFPTKYDIHEYGIMERFIESLPPGTARQELAQAIRGKGAFRRFKNGIYYHRLNQQWYAYQAQAYREIAIRWCMDQGLEYVDES